MLVRAAHNEDKEAWLRMRCALWPECDESTQRREIESWLVHPGRRETFVAEDEGERLTGFAEVSIREHIAAGGEPEQICYLEGWYVDADQRRRGVGQRLVEAAEQWARQRGCRKMLSDAALDNLASHQAHLAIGFSETDRAVNFTKPL